MSDTQQTPATILLRNGTIISHVPPTEQHIDYSIDILTKHSLLISGDRITKIAPRIDAPSSETKIVDCTNKIIAPGFVDTHHHLWQTQLKGRHGDDTFLDYMGKGNFQSFHYSPNDIYWGQLGGCLEALDAGTTTVVDHATLNCTPDHSPAAISATVASGIRSIFCYTPTNRAKSLVPFEMNHDLMPDWLMPQFERLANEQPFGDGRVRLGFAFDQVFLPRETVVGIFKKVRGLGAQLITSHTLNPKYPIFRGSSPIDILASYELLGPDLLFSHANDLTPHSISLLHKDGGSISSTPHTELQMSFGHPACFQPSLHPRSSLGIDCHSCGASDIIGQMRMGLQAERARHDAPMLDKGKMPRRVVSKVGQAYNLGTILGARAVGMEDQIGSLTEGKQADVLIFDAASPAMVCAAQRDPVTAIVLHASVRDIEGVIVKGVFRKEGGKLANVMVEGEELAWEDVVRELLNSRLGIERKAECLDYERLSQDLIKAWHVDEGDLVGV